jgi:dTDP-4-dehydrorhamnose reductase
MRVIVAGSGGYVGGLVCRGLAASGAEVLGVDLKPSSGPFRTFTCDLASPESLSSLTGISPDMVINAAGNKDILFCEQSPSAASRANCSTVKALCRAFPNSKIVYISTDYVFDGKKGGYSEHDIPAPETEYGRSKLCGEETGFNMSPGRFAVIRISALYDPWAPFLRFLYSNLSVGKSVGCFDDVRYSPTYHKDLISALSMLSRSWPEGKSVFHVSGSAITRFDFAIKFAAVFGFDAALVKVEKGVKSGGSMFPDLSLNSSLTSKVLGIKFTSLDDSFADMKGEINADAPPI